MFKFILQSTIIESYPDGSYAVIETRIDDSSLTAYSTSRTKSASRTYTYYSSSNTREWDFSVRGTFSYDGSSARATSVSTDYNIYKSGWTMLSRTSSKTGATVSATGKFKYSLMTKSTTIGLKCSSNGTISAI